MMAALTFFGILSAITIAGALVVFLVAKRFELDL